MNKNTYLLGIFFSISVGFTAYLSTGNIGIGGSYAVSAMLFCVFLCAAINTRTTVIQKPS